MKLYEVNNEINRLITDSVDAETGEWLGSELDAEALQMLNMERAEKIRNIGCLIKNAQADIDALDAEKKRLDRRIKGKKNLIDSLTYYLDHEMEDGEPFECPEFVFAYRKSEAVEVEDGFVLEAMSNPLLESCLTYKNPEPNKTAIKKLIKSGAEVPFARLVSRINRSIK